MSTTTSSPTSTKRDWGATQKQQHADDDAAPLLKRSNNNEPVKLLEFDTSQLEISPTVKDGSIGDKFCEVSYKRQRLSIKFDDLPQWRRSPFKAGPAKTKDGKQLGDSWGMVLEISPEEYDRYREIEQHVIRELAPRATELMQHTLKKPAAGKPAKKISPSEFEDLYNSPLKAADPEKGYKATIRIGVPHENVGKDGKPRELPTIWLTKLKGENQWTKPKAGSIHDLDKNVALCPVVKLFRGAYFGNTGWGMRFVLDSAFIFTNKGGNSGPTLDTAHMNVVPDSDDDEPNAKSNQEPGATSDAPPALAGGYDDGSGGVGELN